MGAALGLSFVLAACDPESSADGSLPDANQCERDSDCRDDGAFCNGGQECVAQTFMTARGPWQIKSCQRTPAPCAPENCNESRNVCSCVDRDVDDDGEDSIGCGGADCDDDDARRSAMRSEVCDAADLDEDCDPSTFGVRDADGDGSPDARCCNGEVCGDDCDDMAQSVHPNAVEACDGRDNNCDGMIDEGVVVPGYPDADGDGWGTGDVEEVCAGTPGYAGIEGDCDDTLSNVHPGSFRCVAGADIEFCTDEASWSADQCPGMGLCVPQPDGTGVCLPGDQAELPQCSDGVDNDVDGQTDWSDPQCSNPLDNTEAERACADGADNDDDGRRDYPDDPGCESSEDADETDAATPPACSNGLDDDNDGIVDYGGSAGDLGCVAASDASEREADGATCDNGADDDGDGPADYPADKSCPTPASNGELKPSCANGLDDDFDGVIDFPADLGCLASNDDSERQSNGNYLCDNGMDDDVDGAFDYPADPGCTGPQDTSE